VAGEAIGSPVAPDSLHILINYDHRPIVSGLQDQTIEDGGSFVSFDLDDYLTELDGESVEWSVAGASNLTADIDGDNVVTVSPTVPGWLGSETLLFTVTDQSANSFSSSDSATFTILPFDHPPTVNTIPDQIIGNGGNFSSIPLGDYLTEEDGDSVHWTYSFNSVTSTDPDPAWTINPADYISTMTVTARVTDRGESLQSTNYTLAAFSSDECRGVVAPVQALDEWLFFLTIYSNDDGDTISFRLYDGVQEVNLPTTETITFVANEALGAPESPYEITAGYFTVSISAQAVATIAAIDPLWAGTESIQFKATDMATLNHYADSTSTVFTILPDHTPVVAGIEDQTIEDGGSFVSFDLDDYLTELDGESVEWSVAGVSSLTADIDGDNVVTVSPTVPGWLGSETLLFTVTDQSANSFSSSDSATFTILPFDHPPMVLAMPSDTIGIGGQFQPIDLDDYLVEQDGQNVVWSYGFASSSDPQPSPEWSVIAADYQYNMTLTTTVLLREQQSTNSNNILGAFVGDSCRGIAEPMEVLGQYIYFLTIFGNTNGESITFKMYDADRGDILSPNDTLAFLSNEIVGTPEAPYAMEAAQITIEFIGNNSIQPSWVGGINGGTENMYFIASDSGTTQALSDTGLVSFTLIPFDFFPTVLEIPGQSIDEGGTFTTFDLNDYLILR